MDTRFPDRLGMTFFHEKVPMSKGKVKYVMAYHSHIHVFNLDDDDDWFIRLKLLRVSYSEYTFYRGIYINYQNALARMLIRVLM